MDKKRVAAARKAAFWKLHAARQAVASLNLRRGPLGHGVVIWTEDQIRSAHAELAIAQREMDTLTAATAK